MSLSLLLFALLALIINSTGYHLKKTNVQINTFLFSDITGTNSDAICGPCPKATKCSGEYLTKGCDGTGKIQGGIATVPVFSWWPIKVFRPCPSYLKAGYQYRREGQTMDQVLFSEPSTKMKEKMEEMRKAKIEDEEVVEPTINIVTPKSIEESEVKKLYNEKFGKKT